jgi:hypothetical protein
MNPTPEVLSPPEPRADSPPPDPALSATVRRPNPRRVAAGRRNRRQRGPLTSAGRQRLRAAALRHQPWRHATGPRSSTGRQRAAQNGRWRQTAQQSRREWRAEIRALLAPLAPLREALAALERAAGAEALAADPADEVAVTAASSPHAHDIRTRS